MGRISLFSNLLSQPHTTMHRQLILPLTLCVLMSAVHSLEVSESAATFNTANAGHCGILYEHSSFNGRRHYVKGPSKFLARFNDRTSSIVVNKGWTMYVFQHRDYKGLGLKLKPGRYDMRRFRRMGNDSISSVYCRRE